MKKKKSQFIPEPFGPDIPNRPWEPEDIDPDDE